MDDKKLRKISKKELLELLLSQAKRIEELELELGKTKRRLESKKIVIDEAGNIAEASLKLNEIFEKAQETADLYLVNVLEKCKRLERDTKRECQKEVLEAKEKLVQIELEIKELTEKKSKRSISKPSPSKAIKAKPRKTTKRKVIA